MELSYLFNSLLKRKWLILGCTVLALVATFFLVLGKSKLYQSSAQYSTGFTIQQVSLVNEEFNSYEADTKFNNVLETFKSLKVIGMLSYDLMLHDITNPSFSFRTISKSALKSEKYESINLERARIILNNKIDSMELLSTFNQEEKKLIEYLELYGYDYSSLTKHLVIERIPRTDYLDISFKSESPYLSAYVVNKIGEEFLKFYISLSSTLTSESVEKISNIVDQKKKQVDSITENLRRVKESQGSIDPSEYSKSVLETVSQLNSKLADEKSNYNKVFYQLQSVSKQLDNPVGGSSDPGAVPQTNNEEIVRIRVKLRELAPHKDDPKVSDQIRKLQEDLKNRELNLNSSSPTMGNPESQRSTLQSTKLDLDQQLKASQQTIAYLNQEISRYSSLNNANAGNEVKVNALKTEVDIATKEYSDIKSKYMQAEGFQQTSTINFKQTLVGQPAVEAEPSHIILIMAIAGFSMFAFSSLIIILLELLDSSIKTPSRFMHVVGLELLNPLNRIGNMKEKDLGNIITSSSSGLTEKDDQILFMRFLRKLRYDVESSGKKVILITSTKKGEGKTTIIEALSASLSMTNKRVLIIDTNFSNNSLTRRFHVNEDYLENFSLPFANEFKSFRNIIKPTNVRSVDIVGCKGGDYTPNEVLVKNGLMENIKFIAEHYDFVLMEGAALNDNSDSQELSRFADGILTVFSADSTINQLDKESIHFLTQTNGKFIGCLLNKVEKENIEI